jgi:hypothetical protein
VDCQRAEAHLRLLAEEELRRPGWAWGERRARVGRVAQLLTAMGALDDEVADQVLADFDLALAARQADAPGLRFGPGMPVSSRSPASRPVPGRLVPLGPATTAGAGTPRAPSARAGSTAGPRCAWRWCRR